MIRTELLRLLTLAAPALARTEFVPILSHFWFTGSKLIAYNDQIGVSVACKTDFKGAVKGDVLLGLIKQSRAREVIFEEVEGGLQIKAGTAKIKLALEAPSAFLWKMPTPDPKHQITITKSAAFLECLQMVMRSVSSDTTIPDKLGVTFMAEEGGVALYAADTESMSYAHFPLKTKWPARVILPALFCEHLNAVCAGTMEKITLEVHEDRVLAECEGVQIYSRIIESERPLPFKETFDENYSAKSSKARVPIPSKMKLILERACIISDSKKESKVQTAIRASEGKLYFSTKSEDRGELSDSSQIGDGHPNVKVNVQARYLKVAYDAYHNAIPEQNGSMLITPRSFMFIKGDGQMLYMLAVSDK
jgi:DNA polymerase III sliding clamp (beta) subunit (PCNA family)